MTKQLDEPSEVDTLTQWPPKAHIVRRDLWLQYLVLLAMLERASKNAWRERSKIQAKLDEIEESLINAL